MVQHYDAPLFEDYFLRHKWIKAVRVEYSIHSTLIVWMHFSRKLLCWTIGAVHIFFIALQHRFYGKL